MKKIALRLSSTKETIEAREVITDHTIENGVLVMGGFRTTAFIEISSLQELKDKMYDVATCRFNLEYFEEEYFFDDLFFGENSINYRPAIAIIYKT